MVKELHTSIKFLCIKPVNTEMGDHLCDIVLVCNQLPRLTQPALLSGMGGEYWQNCIYAL